MFEHTFYVVDEGESFSVRVVLHAPVEREPTRFECPVEIVEKEESQVERSLYGADAWQSLMIGIHFLRMEVGQRYGDLRIYWSDPADDAEAERTSVTSIFGGLTTSERD